MIVEPGGGGHADVVRNLMVVLKGVRVVSKPEAVTTVTVWMGLNLMEVDLLGGELIIAVVTFSLLLIPLRDLAFLGFCAGLTVGLKLVPIALLSVSVGLFVGLRVGSERVLVTVFVVNVKKCLLFAFVVTV